MIGRASSLAILICLHAASGAFGSPRVVSVDQCADQYVLALSPRDDIAALSPRARALDSYMRAAAIGLPLRRPSTEDVLAERPDVVVRSWGGGARLSALLKRRGLSVAQIAPAEDFEAVRGNIRTVSSALGQPQRGAALIARMNAELAAAKGAWKGDAGLYLTSGGFTAGRGTMADAIMTAAGMRNVVKTAGFSEMKLERLVLDPPKTFVLGFFEPASLSPWAPGRAGVVQKLIAGRRTIRIPAALLGCSGWFSADATRLLAKAAK